MISVSLLSLLTASFLNILNDKLFLKRDQDIWALSLFSSLFFFTPDSVQSCYTFRSLRDYDHSKSVWASGEVSDLLREVLRKLLEGNKKKECRFLYTLSTSTALKLATAARRCNPHDDAMTRIADVAVAEVTSVNIRLDLDGAAWIHLRKLLTNAANGTWVWSRFQKDSTGTGRISIGTPCKGLAGNLIEFVNG